MNEKLLNRVENIDTNEKIAYSEQSPLLSQCFDRSFAAEVSESVCMCQMLKTSDEKETYIYRVFEISPL